MKLALLFSYAHSRRIQQLHANHGLTIINRKTEDLFILFSARARARARSRSHARR